MPPRPSDGEAAPDELELDESSLSSSSELELDESEEDESSDSLDDSLLPLAAPCCAECPERADLPPPPPPAGGWPEEAGGPELAAAGAAALLALAPLLLPPPLLEGWFSFCSRSSSLCSCCRFISRDSSSL